VIESQLVVFFAASVASLYEALRHLSFDACASAVGAFYSLPIR